MAKDLETKMADVDLEDEEEGDDVPIFTPELAKLRARERGEDVSDEDMQDDEGKRKKKKLRGPRKRDSTLMPSRIARKRKKTTPFARVTPSL